MYDPCSTTVKMVMGGLFIYVKILYHIMRFMVFWRSLVLWQVFCNLRGWSERCGPKMWRCKTKSAAFPKCALRGLVFQVILWKIKTLLHYEFRANSALLSSCTSRMMLLQPVGVILEWCPPAVLVEVPPELGGGRGRRNGWAVLSSSLSLDLCFGS